MGGDRFYSSSSWRRVRLVVLERDGWVCQIRASGCTLAAEHVDHIVPRGLGGHSLAPSNLRAACAKCNLGRPSPRVRADAEGELGVVGPSRVW